MWSPPATLHHMPWGSPPQHSRQPCLPWLASTGLFHTRLTSTHMCGGCCRPGRAQSCVCANPPAVHEPNRATRVQHAVTTGNRLPLAVV
eukprot:364653-Chlamydomonas_euryale.AAC.11